ncbi:MAG: fumarylacetoacetate hydrolase family protein [Anaerolineae bacterium]|nr:fumarylacetoacetate hydrolase family protein [Anaerolineae bacterium]MBL8106996.1 fumarylacetoacetate hydrolase family protein [Anaerolineales bacterium]MCC7187560.1 fumarylacetoacetate hydrolase family protein [Anaerolineales bacterium]
MKFATVSTLRATTQPAIVVDDRVHTLPYPDMLAVIAAGAGAASQKAAKESLALDEVKFLSPIHPKTLRDAYAFETHVKTANRNRGQDVPENWYKFPVFYFSNPTNDFGHDDVIPHPAYTNAIDFELEIAVIIGKAGMNIKAEDAPKHIFGYTIFNDWSARDLQVQEMRVNFGPVKSKDFASSYGPVIVTHESLADKATTRPGVYDLLMTAKINGTEVSRGNFNDIYWSFGDIIARASESVMLQPGDVIGSGTVGTGCLYELTKNQGPWLNEGDVVELEVERIGLLRNTVGAKG